MEQIRTQTLVKKYHSRLIGDNSVSFYSDNLTAVFVKPISNERDWSLEVYRKSESEPFKTVVFARNLEELKFIKDVIVNISWEFNLDNL